MSRILRAWPTICLPSLVLAEDSAGAYIGYTAATLRAWRRQGRGPAYVRHNQLVRYRVVDLDDWVTVHRIEPADSRDSRGRQ